ncbi:transposase family protein [Actinomyces sp.]|uniref:transposase family protein n=1 Tax=Actinomyces sp. TaxID=29317 RepID=UPI00361481D1
MAWVSDPQDGCTHDAKALRRCGLLDVPATDLPDGASPPGHIGDKGYIGLGMITPKRKPPNLSLHPDDKAYNKTVNQVRYKIERVIASIKTWRVLHTGYRRPLDTFPETITAVLGLIFTSTP